MFVKKVLPVLILLSFFIATLVVRNDVRRFAPLGEAVYAANYQRQENTEVFKHVLYVLTVYRDNPIAKHQFAPYVGASPNFLPNRFNPLLIVYPSFSPVFFIVPYLFLTLLHIGLSYSGLQLFSLALHFVCIIMVYLLVRTLLPRRKLAVFVALLCASVYAFSTSTLQNHMNVYWAHQLLQPFYFGAVLLFIKRKGLLKPWEAAVMGFVLSIIAWTGLVVSVGFAGYYAWRYHKRKDKADLWRAVAVLSGITAAVLLVAGQILWITGASAPLYISKIFLRVQARSFDPGYTTSVFVIPLRFLLNVAIDAGAYIVLALVFAGMYWRRWRHTTNIALTAVFLTLFPLLESIPLLEHDTVYGFGRLKLFVPLIIILALGAYEFVVRAKHTWRAAWLLTGLFAVAALIHIFLFLDIYTPKF
jgi:hypothetical protein